jgi:hypothetical protein
MKSIAFALGLFVSHSLLVSGQIAIYEFSGSSTGDNQFNEVTAQPSGGTFSSFTRSGVTWNTGNDVFTSKSWSTSTTLDSTKYVGFSITPSSGLHLDLTQLTFKNSRSSTGPSSGTVSLFLNDSSTATESFSFSPPSSTTSSSFTFDFADVLASSKAEFRFFGFNATGGTGTLRFDDVTAYGAFSAVPEPHEYAIAAGVGLLGFAIYRHRKQLQKAPVIK